jgi:hypothetical protein
MAKLQKLELTWIGEGYAAEAVTKNVAKGL